MRRNCWRRSILWIGQPTTIYTKQKSCENFIYANVKIIQSKCRIFHIYHFIFWFYNCILIFHCLHNKDTTNYRERYVNLPNELVKSMQKSHFGRRWARCCWKNCTYLDWYQPNGISTMRSIYRPVVFVGDVCPLSWLEVSWWHDSDWSTSLKYSMHSNINL